jgi:hypothetical protein
LDNSSRNIGLAFADESRSLAPVLRGRRPQLIQRGRAFEVTQDESRQTPNRERGSGAPTLPTDRLGDLISVEQDRCTVDSGPLIGGVLIEVIIWEWDKTKTNAVLLSGSGVIRKPGSTLAFQITEGKMASSITDGKVTGATSSGRGNDGVATGGAASLSGKSYTWSTKSTGKLQFVLGVEME